MNVKYFLKVLEKEGYPNPDLLSIVNVLGYDLDDFLPDLEKEIGNKGVLDFCKKAIVKLTGKKGLRIDLPGPNDDEFVYLHLYPVDYDPDESENDIVCNHGWGESKIISKVSDGSEIYSTIQEIIENSDFSDWTDLDDLIEQIRTLAYNEVFNNCGFGIWWT